MTHRSALTMAAVRSCASVNTHTQARTDARTLTCFAISFKTSGGGWTSGASGRHKHSLVRVLWAGVDRGSVLSGRQAEQPERPSAELQPPTHPQHRSGASGGRAPTVRAYRCSASSGKPHPVTHLLPSLLFVCSICVSLLSPSLLPLTLALPVRLSHSASLSLSRTPPPPLSPSLSYPLSPTPPLSELSDPASPSLLLSLHQFHGG